MNSRQSSVSDFGSLKQRSTLGDNGDVGDLGCFDDDDYDHYVNGNFLLA